MNNANKIDVKSSALTGQRVIKLTQNGEDIFLPVGLSSLTPNGGSDDGESEDNFYMATSFSGMLSEIEVTAGNVTNGMYEYPVSLVGKYTIVDPGAHGTNRKWVCNATIANDGEESEKVYLRTIAIPAGFDDDGNDIYEEIWGFTASDSDYEYSAFLCADTENESPLNTTKYYRLGDTSGFVSPVFAPAVDEPPYGPTGWNGKRMVWGEHPIYITYGGKLENSNGYWVRIDEGQPLSVESTWVNLNGKARIEISSKTNAWVYWWMYVQDDTGADIPAYKAGGSSNQFMSDSLIHPFKPEAALRHNSTDFIPAPTMVMADEGWYPADTETTGLPIKKNAPAIGSIYNSDATVRIAAMYPAK